MRKFDPLAALGLPDSGLVDRRVPKSLLIENGARTPADKRHIREGVEELRWVAALKPATVGVDVYRDSAREYVEIAVLRLTLRSGAATERITALLHRSVPYPVLLLSWQQGCQELSLAHKRRSKADAGRMVIDGDIVAVRPSDGYSEELTYAFGSSLALARQPRSTLHTLYQGWIDALNALRASSVTGVFSIPASRMEAEGRAATLREYRDLENRIANLRTAAKREKQIARRVEMNLQLRRLRAGLAAAEGRL